MRKFATAEILDAVIARADTPLMRTAHRATFHYEPKHGMLYVRSRMISSRCNDNFDEFPADEIRAGWPTFIGKPVFVNHHNDDHRRNRGVIIDAVLHEDRTPDGRPDIWVEGLMEVDALTYPKLAKAIVAKEIDRTSMGVDVAFSVCAACGNKATTPMEYCAHIPGQKGKIFVSARSGQRTETLIRERCHGLRFFENSLLVEEPADPTAFTLGDVVLGPGLEHLSMKRTASRQLVAAPPSAGPIWMEPAPRTAALRFFAAGVCPSCESDDTIATTASNGFGECLSCEAAFTLEAAGPRYPDPGDHPFFQAHPVHHDHIVAHWNAATDDERASGKRWYPDAGLVAKALGTLHHGEHPAGNTHLAAGMIANYSPQTGWDDNKHNAARALHEGKGIGGKGSGIFASAKQADTANRLMAGEHHTDIMKTPKVSDFAHLVEHGGDADPNKPHVVIDRHALAVASQHPDSGERLPDDHYEKFPSSQRHYYGHVVDAYHRASAVISHQEGEHVPPHAVQATTWLARQRLNQTAERAIAQQDPSAPRVRLDQGREKARARATEKWNDFRTTHLPDLKDDPGSGYVARRGTRSRAGRRIRPADPGDQERVRALGYGEIKAPAQVDTLRDEACPVCGETEAWDGDKCMVCGFVAPPDKFQDPNVDMAKQVDLRAKDDGTLDAGDVPGLNADTNDVDGDGLDDNTGLPVDDEAAGAMDQQPMLVCPNCGFQVEGGEPTTVDTAQAQGLPNADSAGPSEGDLCPACGQALLEGQAQALDQGDTGDAEQMDPDDPDAPVDPDDPHAQAQADADVDGSEEPSDDDPDPDDGKNPFGAKGDDSDDDSEDDVDQDQDDDSDDEDDDDKDKKPKRLPNAFGT